jgi:uncharacterized repeat protein (TIGR03943 family)
VNRQAQAVIMLLVGGAVLRTSLTDDYLRYVKPGLRPFLIAAAAVLIVTAVMTLWYELRGTKTPEPDCEGAAVGHDGGHAHEPKVAWLLILPVFGLLLVAPPALGSYAAGQAGSVLASQQVSDYPPLPPGDPAKITVLDYASRAVFDKGASLGERTVQLTGFVTTGPDGQPMLARIILSCCAADGRPIKVGLSGNTPTSVPADTWVEIVGQYSTRTATDPVNKAIVPYLEVETWRQIEPPKQQYE